MLTERRISATQGLGHLKDGKMIGSVRESETSILMATFRNRETGKLMTSDPRFLPEALKGLYKAFLSRSSQEQKGTTMGQIASQSFHDCGSLERKERVTLSVLFEAMMRHVLLTSNVFCMVGFS